MFGRGKNFHTKQSLVTKSIPGVVCHTVRKHSTDWLLLNSGGDGGWKVAT